MAEETFVYVIDRKRLEVYLTIKGDGLRPAKGRARHVDSDLLGPVPNEYARVFLDAFTQPYRALGYRVVFSDKVRQEWRS